MGIRAGGGLGYILMPALFSDISLDLLEDNNSENTTSENTTALKAKIGERFIIFQSTLAGVSSLFLLMLAIVYRQGCSVEQGRVAL